MKFRMFLVNIFIWRAVLDRISTRVNLNSRGTVLPFALSPVCLEVSESTTHCLASCPTARAIWF